jgi:hypothetical protein
MFLLVSMVGTAVALARQLARQLLSLTTSWTSCVALRRRSEQAGVGGTNAK